MVFHFLCALMGAGMSVQPAPGGAVSEVLLIAICLFMHSRLSMQKYPECFCAGDVGEVEECVDKEVLILLPCLSP